MIAINRPAAGVIANNIESFQFSVTSTAQELISSRDLRMKVSIKNTGATDVFVGNSSVTTANGYLLSAGESIKIEATSEIYIISSGTSTVSVLEEFVATG